MLVHPPSYFGASLAPDALLAHYHAVADASPVPVLVYHIPKFTHVTLEPGLVGEIARHPNVAGLKDSSGDVKRFAAYSEVVPPGFSLLVGSGGLLYTALELGAAGGASPSDSSRRANAPESCMSSGRETRATPDASRRGSPPCMTRWWPPTGPAG